MYDSTVAIARAAGMYPSEAPFSPESAYPECGHGESATCAPNPAYFAVREALRLLGLDQNRFGTAAWNPLGELISPGDTVLLKPNFIRESHALHPDQWQQVITHGSIIRAMIDYAAIALCGSGRIIVADGPQTDSDLDLIRQRTGMDEIVALRRGRGLDVQLLDLRRERWFQKGEVIYKRVSLPGDPAGYTTVDLGAASEFSSYRLNGRFYGADYDLEDTASFHSNGRHAYVVCRTVLDADVVINLPKLKTHKKTGVTLSLKNMVGINGYRNCLPHHTVGTPSEGGDEFMASRTSHRLQSRAVVLFKKLLVATGGRGGAWSRAIKGVGSLVFGNTNRVVRSGNWYGNDTTWRMVLDLNKGLFHFDGEGRPRRKPLRYMTLVDGIVAGQGNGPMAPDPVPAGLIVAGLNPVAVDTVCTLLMGFDYRRVPVVARAWETRDYPLVGFAPKAVSCMANVREWDGSLEELEAAPHLAFLPHFGWRGQIERECLKDRAEPGGHPSSGISP